MYAVPADVMSVVKTTVLTAAVTVVVDMIVGNPAPCIPVAPVEPIEPPPTVNTPDVVIANPGPIIIPPSVVVVAG